MAQPNSPDPFDDLKSSFNVLTFLMEVHSLWLIYWLRKPGSLGARYPPGLHVLAALIYVPCWALFFPPPEAVAVNAFWISGMVMMALHRVAGADEETHSLFTGESWIPGDAWRVKGFCEPFLLLIATICAAPWPALACYFGVGAFTVAGTVAMAKQRQNSILRARRDAQIEAEVYAAEE